MASLFYTLSHLLIISILMLVYVAVPSFTKPIAITSPTTCAKVDVNAPCCPVPTTKVKDFKPPVRNGPLRVRRPAHRLDNEYIEKYTRAVELMKALPQSDPRSFTQQGSIHCAYCYGAYRQINNTNMEVQIHQSWLFHPFHRYYIYFHEKILGKLIGDPDFALPYWNWDSPQGMMMPSMYANRSSPLHDIKRNQNHYPPKLVDLNYDFVERNLSVHDQVSQNLAAMYRNMVYNGQTGSLFFGKPYRVGDNPFPGAGSIELVPHNSVHLWVGHMGDNEDMGTFYSSARDPIFYSHHANIDRLWTLWRKLGGDPKRALNDPDWLEASFIFYDENAEAVRVKVKDCLRTADLGYYYEPVDVPWIKAKPKPRRKKASFSLDAVEHAQVEGRAFPFTLDSVFSTRVGRTVMKNAGDVEILMIQGIEFRRDVPAKFDVYVNERDWRESTPANSEFAGSFLNIPNKLKQGMTLKTTLRLAITDLLRDVGAENDDNILVTLVPRYGQGHIKIDGIGIGIAFE